MLNEQTNQSITAEAEFLKCWTSLVPAVWRLVNAAVARSPEASLLDTCAVCGHCLAKHSGDCDYCPGANTTFRIELSQAAKDAAAEELKEQLVVAQSALERAHENGSSLLRAAMAELNDLRSALAKKEKELAEEQAFREESDNSVFWSARDSKGEIQHYKASPFDAATLIAKLSETSDALRAQLQQAEHEVKAWRDEVAGTASGATFVTIKNLRAAVEQAEQERDEARRERDPSWEYVDKLRAERYALQQQNAELEQRYQEAAWSRDHFTVKYSKAEARNAELVKVLEAISKIDDPTHDAIVFAKVHLALNQSPELS